MAYTYIIDGTQKTNGENEMNNELKKELAELVNTAYDFLSQKAIRLAKNNPDQIILHQYAEVCSWRHNIPAEILQDEKLHIAYNVNGLVSSLNF
jgi:hypothetical protein